MSEVLPTTHRVWAWREKGEPQTLRSELRPLPEPGPDDVLVANRTIGLNPVDWKMIAWGNPAWTPGRVPGVDGVGVIVSVGRNVRLPVGLRVAYHQSLARDGSFAEFTLADARGIIPIPDSVDNVTAAALPCPALTAWQALEKVPPCDDSRDILVVGAGGAVGLFLSQLALRRRWRVWVTASPAHNQRLLSLGVSGVFDYCTDDWRKRLQNMLGPRKLHAVFDTVSGRHASSLASMIGYNGHLICIQDRIDENPLAPFTTAISLHEVALNSIYMYAAEEDWRDWRDAGASLFDMCSRENLEIPVIETFEFSVLPTALLRIKNKLNSGTSVVCL